MTVSTIAVAIIIVSSSIAIANSNRQVQSNQFTTYQRFGSSECPAIDGVTMIYTGVTVAFAPSLGSTDFKCIPKQNEDNGYSEKIAYYNETFGKFDDKGGGVVAHYPNVTEYRTFRVDSNHYDVPCALCSVEQRTTIQVIPSSYKCPPAWTLEYNGYLMTDRSTTVFVCVDIEMEVLNNSQDPRTNAPTLDHVIVQDIPHISDDNYKPTYVLSCAVCSR